MHRRSRAHLGWWIVDGAIPVISNVIRFNRFRLKHASPMDFIERTRIVSYLLRNERYADLWHLVRDSRDLRYRNRSDRISTEDESAIETLLSCVMRHLLFLDESGANSIIESTPDNRQGSRCDECLSVWYKLHAVGIADDLLAAYITEAGLNISELD